MSPALCLSLPSLSLRRQRLNWAMAGSVPASTVTARVTAAARSAVPPLAVNVPETGPGRRVTDLSVQEATDRNALTIDPVPVRPEIASPQVAIVLERVRLVALAAAVIARSAAVQIPAAIIRLAGNRLARSPAVFQNLAASQNREVSR